MNAIPGICIEPSVGTKYEFRDFQPQEMFTGAVRFRPTLVGECPTAKAVMSGKYGMAPDGEQFLILGHETYGVSSDDIDCDVPDGAIKAGGRYMVNVRVPRPGVNGFAARAPQLCSDPSKWVEHGLYGGHGGYREEMVVHHSHLIPVPDDVSDKLAVFSEGWSCVNQGVRKGIRFWNVNLDGVQYTDAKKALILGTGSAAIAAVCLYKIRGFNCYVVGRKKPGDPAAKRLQKLGAVYIQSNEQDGFVEDLVSEYGPFVQVFEGTGSPIVRARFRQAVGDSGFMVVYGIPEEDCCITLNLTTPMVQEVTTTSGSVGAINCNARKDWTQAMQALAWTNTQHPWLFPELVHEVKFCPEAIMKAVDDRHVKPIVRIAA